jgi:hypothetical protein
MGCLSAKNVLAAVDPASAIVNVLAASAMTALEGLTNHSVKNAYDGLKALIAERYKRRGAIDAVEEDPHSAACQQALAEALSKTGATADPEVFVKTLALTEALNALPKQDILGHGLDLARVKAAEVEIQHIRAGGTGLRATDAEIAGDVNVKDIRAAVSARKRPARTDPLASLPTVEMKSIQVGRDLDLS